jgi:hypothetical protein
MTEAAAVVPPAPVGRDRRVPSRTDVDLTRLAFDEGPAAALLSLSVDL